MGISRGVEKEKKKKKGTDMFPNGIDLVESWKVWVGTKAINNNKGYY